MLEFSIHKLQFCLCISRFPIPHIHFGKISERRNKKERGKRKRSEQKKEEMGFLKKGQLAEPQIGFILPFLCVIWTTHVLKLIFSTSKVSPGWYSVLTSAYPT